MNSVPARRIAATFLALLMFCSVSSTLSAQEQGQKAEITVYQIEASNGEPGIDPQIQPLVKEFEGAFRYSTYRLVSKIPQRMGPDDKQKISIPGNREMHLHMLGYDGNRIRLNVRVVEKKGTERRELLDTEFRLVEGGTILIGGYGYRDGKLIVAISAK